jgi:hypothetical protein
MIKRKIGISFFVVGILVQPSGNEKTKTTIATRIIVALASPPNIPSQKRLHPETTLRGLACDGTFSDSVIGHVSAFQY